MPEWQGADIPQEPEENQLDDIRLIDEAQKGNAEAFGDLYERHAPAVFRFLYAHLNHRLDAEDLTEEVFVRVWRTLPAYQHQGAPFVAFLFRVARNALIDHYRRSNKEFQWVELDDQVSRDEHNDPAELLAKEGEYQGLRHVMADLRDDYRMVLVLRFLSDLSPEETAEVMGRSPGAVRVLQHRALGALRKLLKVEK